MSKDPRKEQQESGATFMLVGWAMATAAIAWWSLPVGLFVAGVSLFAHGFIQYRNT